MSFQCRQETCRQASQILQSCGQAKFTGGYQLDRLDVLPPSQFLEGPSQMLISSQLPLPYLGLPNTVACYLHFRRYLERLLHLLPPDDCHAFLALAESQLAKLSSHLSAPTWLALLQVDLHGRCHFPITPAH